jgi:hypothetical protein
VGRHNWNFCGSDDGALIDVNYFCRIATIILAGSGQV